MVRSFVAAIASLCILTPALAQDDRLDELSFDEEQLKEEVVPYFAIGVGPVFNFALPSTTDVNARAAALGLSDMKAPLIQVGAEIFAAIGVLPNVRLGFSWVSGSLSSSSDGLTIGTSSVSVKRTITYGITSRAFHLDYAIVPMKSLAILPGVGLGWGEQSIETYQSVSNLSWTDLTNDEAFAPAPNAFTRLQQNTLYVLPRLNIEYAVTPFLNLRAQAAYTLLLSGSDWIANNNATVSNVPSGISVNGLSFQVGILVGLFN
jgi:hypothetical protein